MDRFQYFRLAEQLNEKYYEELIAFPARFRGSFKSLSIISLRCDMPQVGISGIQNTVRRADFDIHALLKQLAAVGGPKRPTPEKELQSWILKKAIKDGFLPFDSEAILITDEFANDESPKVVADILAFNMQKDTLVIIELKSERKLLRLTDQLNTAEKGIQYDIPSFKKFLDDHSLPWQEPYPIEKIAVWPKNTSNEKRFPADIREFVYVKDGCHYYIEEVF